MKKLTIILFFTALSSVFGAVNFVQLTDPHLFDKPGRETDIADSQRAFSNCIVKINDMNLTSHFKFVAITGDIGIENFNPSCDSVRWDEAVKVFVQALKPSQIDTWLFVPGNNDIANENPANIGIYNRFIDDVRAKLQPDGFQIIDLCPSNTAAPGLSLSRDYPIGQYHFLGFNDSCFKGDNKGANAASFYTNQMEYIDQIAKQLTNDFVYIFYHIPEIDDPGSLSADVARLNKLRKDKNPFNVGDEVYRAWTVSNDVRVAWSNVTANPKVKALIAGHFHSDNAICYSNFDWLKNTDYGAVTSLNPQKLFIAPPISVKFQTGPIQARGFRTFSISNNGDITSQVVWYRGAQTVEKTIPKNCRFKRESCSDKSEPNPQHCDVCVMDVARLALEFLKILVWPIVIVLMLFRYRRHLDRLVERICHETDEFQSSFLGLSAKFRKDVREVKQITMSLHAPELSDKLKEVTKDQFRLLSTGFYTKSLRERLQLAEEVAEVSLDLDIKDLISFACSVVPGERVAAAIGIRSHIQNKSNFEITDEIIKVVRDGLLDSASRVRFRFLQIVVENRRLATKMKEQLLKMADNDDNKAVRDLAQKICLRLLG